MTLSHRMNQRGGGASGVVEVSGTNNVAVGATSSLLECSASEALTPLQCDRCAGWSRGLGVLTRDLGVLNGSADRCVRRGVQLELRD